MKKLLMCLPVLTLIVSMPLTANNIFGTGAQSCGKWVANNQEGPYEDFHMVGWISGYISAINTEYDLQKGVNKSYESIYYAVKNRCEKAPLDLVAEAIQWVVRNEL